jgi:hypothetical protein
MFSKAFAVGLLALACVMAAAGGAYVAVRHNTVPAAATASPAAAAPAPDRAGSTGSATPAAHDTEAVITPPPSQAEPQPLERLDRPAPAPAPKPSVDARTTRPTRAEASKSPVARPISRPASRTAPAPDTPNGTANSAPSAPETTAAATRTEPPAAESTPVEAARPDPPPAAPTRMFDEVVVPSSSVIGLQIETPVSSERARLEDRVEARVLRDVMVDGRTAVPAGTRAIGAVTLVDRGGKVKERARLGVRFHTLVLADGTELPMRTDAILREGDSPTGESTRKIGGAAVGGAILGAIIGGKKGAIVGGATGAAGGSAVVMAGDRNAATLPVGAVVTVRLAAPVTVEVERH